MKQQFEYRPIHGQRERKYAPVRPDDGPDNLVVTNKMKWMLIASWVVTIGGITLVLWIVKH